MKAGHNLALISNMYWKFVESLAEYMATDIIKNFLYDAEARAAVGDKSFLKDYESDHISTLVTKYKEKALVATNMPSDTHSNMGLIREVLRTKLDVTLSHEGFKRCGATIVALGGGISDTIRVSASW